MLAGRVNSVRSTEMSWGLARHNNTVRREDTDEEKDGLKMEEEGDDRGEAEDGEEGCVRLTCRPAALRGSWA